MEQPLTDLRALPLPVLFGEDVILEIVDHLLEALDRAEVAVHHLVEQHVQGEPGALRQQLRLALPSTHRLLHVETGRESEGHQEPVTGERVDLGLGEVGHHAAIAVVDGGRSQHHEHVVAEQLHLRPLTAVASVLHHQGMQPELSGERPEGGLRRVLDIDPDEHPGLLGQRGDPVDRRAFIRADAVSEHDPFHHGRSLSDGRRYTPGDDHAPRPRAPVLARARRTLRVGGTGVVGSRGHRRSLPHDLGRQLRAGRRRGPGPAPRRDRGPPPACPARRGRPGDARGDVPSGGGHVAAIGPIQPRGPARVGPGDGPRRRTAAPDRRRGDTARGS